MKKDLRSQISNMIVAGFNVGLVWDLRSLSMLHPFALGV